MAPFKNAEEREAARDLREQEKAAQRERRELGRRGEALAKLVRLGVLDEDDDVPGASTERLREMYAEHLQARIQERELQRRQRASLAALGVYVESGGTVCDARWGRPLGPLAGAHAEVTSSLRQHRVNAAISAAIQTAGAGLGPTGAVVGLSKKSAAIAVVAFPDGTLHQYLLEGAPAVQRAEVAAIAFNTMAQAADGTRLPAAHSSPDQSDGPASVSSAPIAEDEIRKLAELHAAGIITDDEFAAKKKQLLGL